MELLFGCREFALAWSEPLATARAARIGPPAGEYGARAILLPTRRPAAWGEELLWHRILPRKRDVASMEQPRTSRTDAARTSSKITPHMDAAAWKRVQALFAEVV